ncbi:MAG: methionine synthase [Candidatus Thermoplasmatota archaeon]|nr:methionine synthase [Candidatus Thermoplasmatota archaeon]
MKTRSNYEFDFNLLPTGIGSLPHLNAQEACKVILENFSEIPFWPQLPNLGFKENMHAQFAYDLPGIIVDYDDKKIFADLEKKLGLEIDSFHRKISECTLTYDKEYFSGLSTMLAKKELLRATKAIKGQITGPISLGLQITDSQSGKALLYNELYREIIVKALNEKAKLQERLLKALNKQIIIFFDEPSLCMYGTPYLNLSREEIVNALTSVVKGLSCLKGVHCCGNTDWSMLLKLPIDIISFDAYSYGERLALFTKELKEFIECGGALAFGIVPSVEENFCRESLETLAAKFDSLLKNFVRKGLSQKEFLRASLLTPSCGLAGMSVESAGKALKLTKELSQKLRERYGS